MKKLLIVLLVGAGSVYGQPELIDKVVAVIGDEIILKSEIEMQTLQYVEQGMLEEGLRCQVINQTLLNKMMLYQARVDSIEVTEDEIGSELDRRIRHFVGMIGSREKLEEYYDKSILEIKNEFRKDIMDYLLSTRMQAKVIKHVKVTPADVKTFFNEIPSDSLPYYNAQVEIAQIVIFPKVSKDQHIYAEDKINDLRTRILGGENFETLASIYSEDPTSAADGGELGFRQRGELVPEFEAAAYNLDRDSVSRVVETKFGFHIIKMIEKRGEKINVRHILIKPKITSFEVKAAKKKIDSIRTAIIEDTLTFANGVAKFSEDEATKVNGGMFVNPSSGTTFFEMDQVDPGVYFAIDDLKVNEVSKSISYQTKDGLEAFRIVQLRSETKAHKASLKDDYHRIQAVALASKQDDALNEWVKERLDNTFIQIDPDYHECKEIKTWLKQNTR